MTNKKKDNINNLYLIEIENSYHNAKWQHHKINVFSHTCLYIQHNKYFKSYINRQPNIYNIMYCI